MGLKQSGGGGDGADVQGKVLIQLCWVQYRPSNIERKDLKGDSKHIQLNPPPPPESILIRVLACEEHSKHGF